MRRRNLHVRVSQEAFDGWVEFAAKHGVTLGALVEAMGLELGKVKRPVSDAGRDMVEMARQIDVQRRSRRRD